MVRVFGIIPARWGSQRFPGKPLAMIRGKPMIQRTWEQVCKCKGIDEVIVATDNLDIFDTIANKGGKAVMTSSSCQSGTDRVHAASKQLDCESNDIIVNIQGDEPFVNPVHVERLVDHMREDAFCNMATLAVEEPRVELDNENSVKVVCNSKGDALFFSRSLIPFPRFHQEDARFLRHIGLYAFTRRFLDRFINLPYSRLENIEGLEQMRVVEAGFPIRVLQVSPPVAPGIDTPEQLAQWNDLFKTS